MESFAAYGHAIASMALMGVFVLIIGPVAAMRKQAAGLAPGATPPADYGNAGYRWHRAHANAAEAAGVFALVTVAAILAGANPHWVNWLASIFLAARGVMLAVHVGGIGAADMGPRSFAYVAGALCCIGLAGLALALVFGG